MKAPKQMPLGLCVYLRMQKPSLPSGTRDFGPKTFKKRKAIMNVMESVFQQHGFMGIETPALENLSTLQGKYGDEGDQLLFKVLNSGAYLDKVAPEVLDPINYNALTSHIAQRGLRYDLTVPLARFVVMNRNEIQFPFKRYQMQPVWRADRPQKGRYREFWQCDVDVVGAQHLLTEVELVEIYAEVFQVLDLEVQIKINHRDILNAFLPLAGTADAWNSFMQAIDKFDKIGMDGVSQELEHRGLAFMIATWKQWCQLADTADFESLIQGMNSIETLQNDYLTKGIQQMQDLWNLLGDIPQKRFDLRLARGLSYYTGCVFEVVPADTRLPQDFKIGSIGGGGRYDNLTGIFGLKDVSGVGVSFGLDRIYDTLEALQAEEQQVVQDGIILCSMLKEAELTAVQWARELRKNSLKVEVYPGSVKLKKQLDYANDKGLKYAIILGEDELKNKSASVKNLVTGEQTNVAYSQLIAFFEHA
jgi:histidyl-tRNA synthetase